MNKAIWMGSLMSMLATMGCTTPVGVAGAYKIPPDAATICAKHCTSIGMKLNAVAIMASNVGCVCQTAGASASGEGSIVAGMATVAMQRAAQQQQRRHGSSH